ncbi:uncharacterized protein LOC133863835 isoform X2 [Alnus glutinosa]|uniref:uncharacterized protein LOC133863835 isoform X2 n=1 Tax=Alnus glutinosa TaxID=3517 RepID=UPI002D769DC8|nr:uncharacterized protein LOC133863835 isoform X2 [Alnus glutinosa]
MFYGSVVWDPWLIVAQIVCLQCLYYLTLGVFLTILVGTRVSRMSLVYFFDYATVTTSTVTGRSVIASFLLSSFAGAGFMLYLIERAKKCLDFSATVYIIHLFICIVYGGWPSSITWWVLNGTGIAVMALLGECLCKYRELQEIPMTRYRSSGTGPRKSPLHTPTTLSKAAAWRRTPVDAFRQPPKVASPHAGDTFQSSSSEEDTGRRILATPKGRPVIPKQDG